MIGLSDFKVGVLIQPELESLINKFSNKRRDMKKEKLLKEVALMIKRSVVKAVSENNKAIEERFEHLC